MDEYSQIFRECYDLLEKSSIDTINQLNEMAKSEFEKAMVAALIEEINRNRKKYKEVLSMGFIYFDKYKDIINENGAWTKVAFTMRRFNEAFEVAVIVAAVYELERIYKKDQETASVG